MDRAKENKAFHGNLTSTKSVRAGVKGVENGMAEDGHVAVDPLHQERRKSSRPQIANTRLSGYDWSSK